MNKWLVKILAACLVVLGGLLWWEKRGHDSTKHELNNQIAKLEGTIQETETVASRRAVEIEKLKTANKELNNIIEDRDESILAMADTNLRLRDKYFKIKKALESVVDKDGNPIPDGEDVPDDARVRVAFEHEKDPLKVTGFTLTNPAYAEVKLEWTRDLKLSLILTKTEDDMFRVYLDSNNSDVETTEINLRVDPSLLEYSWYEKIGIIADLSVGAGVTSGVGIIYDIRKNWFVGPNIKWNYDGNKFRKFYGINVGLYPFR